MQLLLQGARCQIQLQSYKNPRHCLRIKRAENSGHMPILRRSPARPTEPAPGRN